MKKNSSSVVVFIAEKILEIAALKKKIKRLETDKKCLENILQTKLPFEVRG